MSVVLLWVMDIAADLGLSIQEKLITRDELYVADEVFFTGTAAEVTPIREIDNRTIGAGNRGPITEQLQRHYFDAVYGRHSNSNYKQWLSIASWWHEYY